MSLQNEDAVQQFNYGIDKTENESYGLKDIFADNCNYCQKNKFRRAKFQLILYLTNIIKYPEGWKLRKMLSKIFMVSGQIKS